MHVQFLSKSNLHFGIIDVKGSTRYITLVTIEKIRYSKNKRCMQLHKVQWLQLQDNFEWLICEKF